MISFNLSCCRRFAVLLLAPFFVVPCHSYDFTLTSEGGFYWPAITDNATTLTNGTAEKMSGQVGERFQNAAINEAGERIGTSQGFAFNFADTSPDPANRNWIFFLEGGQVDVLDRAIVSGTGIYEKYTGGTVEQVIASVDPEYVSEITLVEPQMLEENEDPKNEGDVHDKFRFGFNTGGVVQLINDASGVQIATTFQVNVLVQNASGDFSVPGGIDQGYAFNFFGASTSSDPYIEKYQAPNSAAEVVLSNRLFFLDGGDLLTTLNNIIVQATGAYSKYTGGSFTSEITSPDPDFVMEITLKEKDLPLNVDATDPVYFYFNISVNEGLSAPILDSSGASVGARYQHPVNNQDGTRIGTILGYSIKFPSLNSTGMSGENGNGNRHLYLEDGEMDVFNSVVVHATGAYVGYIGGRLETKQRKPIVEIKLNGPSSQASESDTTSPPPGPTGQPLSEPSYGCRKAGNISVLLLTALSFLIF